MITRWKHAAAGVVLAGALVLIGQPASAATTCAAPVPSTTQPGYTVFDPNCEIDGTPFTALPGAHVFTGIKDGAAYRIEVPRHWNGKLVVYTHGYRGLGTTVYVDNPALRAHYIALGYAWTASSYATNGYDVGQGVRDSYSLIDLFHQVTGARARSVYMTGASMGGQVTAVMIEKHPKTFVGAMPYCGVLGDTSLFDYFLDANVTAADLAGVKIPFDVDQDTWTADVARILPELGVNVGTPPNLTAAGKTWSSVVERDTGGVRPGWDSAFAYWNTATSIAPLTSLPFLFGLYPGLTGGTENIATGNVTGNLHTIYRSGNLRTDIQLNRSVLRVAPTATASPDLSGIPRVYGRPSIPVLSLHDIGDMFVPISMDQDYARRVAANGRANLFVDRAIRGVTHCDFTQQELSSGFDDLVHWVNTGHRPAGDAILNQRAVASPAFGCRFTNGSHLYFDAPACPAKP